jgi:hypothetical protein
MRAKGVVDEGGGFDFFGRTSDTDGAVECLMTSSFRTEHSGKILGKYGKFTLGTDCIVVSCSTFFMSQKTI